MKRGEPSACDACLRRAWLVGGLAPLIELVTESSPGRRSHELLALPDEELARALARDRAGRLLSEARGRDPARLRAAVGSCGAWACCLHQPGYPAALLEGGQAPAVLFGRGDPERLSALEPPGAVTIVGARRPSAYGREMARRLGSELAAAGVAVISGLALGIDSAAHEGALAAGGLTVAVLGSGPDVVHPVRKRRLHEQIAERGLLLSELPPGVRPWRWTFPARNRIMAALGEMTVVVEARARSGSLITSGMAVDLGREVGAVPGQVGASPAEGTNGMLRDGAQVIRGAQDVLDSLLGPGVIRLEGRSPELSAELRRALEAIEHGARNADAAARISGLPAPQAATALARLELLGYLRAGSGGGYVRTPLAAPAATEDAFGAALPGD